MTLAPVAEVRRYVLDSCRRLSPVDMPLASALGLVLAGQVTASEDIPPFANSSMDGYALRACDLAEVPARLAVIGALMAGDDPAPFEVGTGQAVRVMTGAALPRGADAVCMLESTRTEGGFVVVEEAVAAGTNLRPAGDDIAAGSPVFAPGLRLGAGHVGVLVSLGVTSVAAYPRPRVGVVSTGDELTEGQGPLGPGKIRDSNRPALLAQLAQDGFVPVDLGRCSDDSASLRDALANATETCDAVLTSGGVSVGDRDLVKAVLGTLGGRRARWAQVAVKPAKPFAFATCPPGEMPVFGLPGNPVSALVSYELFARPALRMMAGQAELGRPVLSAVADEDLWRRPDGKLHLVRVALRPGEDGVPRATLSGPQGSHQMAALANASALALLEDGYGVPAGTAVTVWLLDPDALCQPEAAGL